MARKILLADDSVTAQNMGRKILTDAGYEVITVNNGSAALKKIAEARPDLIVLDVYMPGYSGLEVCQRLKEAQETARIPVLLTVGKLEPFKPEEAKRVRADAYIVKPFEASELLSALTKLEDKVVPRSESSKPGRFARSIAAIEEGRYDRTMAVEEDAGWKNRIGFPSKKKQKASETDDGDDPAIYNALNKDLRTVVDHSPAAGPEPSQESKPDAHVDLAALAPAGLPSDVTPEEIAALAAAAAQVKSSTAAKTTEDAKPIEAVAADESKVEEKVSVAAPVENVVGAPADTAPTSGTEGGIVASEPQIEPLASQAEAQASTEAAPSLSQAHAHADEPVTMAAAAGAGSGTSASRWTAVAVALAPEETDISLEAEMQRAYGALAGTQPVESAPVMEPAERASMASGPVIEAITQAAMPEVEQTLSEIAGATMDSMTGGTITSEAMTGDATSAGTDEPQTAAASQLASEPVPQEQAELIQASVTPVEAPAPAEISAAQPDGNAPDNRADEQFASVATSVVASSEENFQPAEAHEDMAVPAAEENRPSDSEVAASAFIPELSAEPVEMSQHTSSEPHNGSEPDATPHATEETEIAASTAAAWASWRHVRETGNIHTEPASESGNGSAGAIPEDSSAMAVAAGAEHHAEDAGKSEPESTEIASIVDSVLADLRPKIFEEISRKLGKKK